jgi:hypothetical protein
MDVTRGDPSGVTSWSMHPGITLTYSAGQIVKAVVPIEQIVSFDMVGALAHGTGAAERFVTRKPGDPNHDPQRDASYHPTKPGVITVPVLGAEILVANTAQTASNIRDHGTSLAASALCAACSSKLCAPPPVGKGGSLRGVRPGYGESKVSDTVQSVIDDWDVSDAELVTIGQKMLVARQHGLGWDALVPGSLGMQANQRVTELHALGELLPPADGYVRQLSDGADALAKRVKEVLPKAEMIMFADVHVESAEKILSAMEKFPLEVRSNVGRLVLGFAEEPNHLAAVGLGTVSVERGVRSNGGATMWFSERAVNPPTGATEGKPYSPDLRTALSAVPADRRHAVMTVHEMGHVIHGMAIKAEGRQASTLIGRTVFMTIQVDPSVPEIATTKYGATNSAETVAESFALGHALGFGNITADQQGVITQTLARAGLDSPAAAMVASSADDIFWDEFFIGDTFLVDDDTEEILEFACYGKVCAPPPVGKGGSLKGGQGGYHLAAMSKAFDERNAPVGGTGSHATQEISDAVSAARAAGLVSGKMFSDEGSDMVLTDRDRAQMAAVLEVGRAVDAEVERRIASDSRHTELQKQLAEIEGKQVDSEADEHWFRSVEYAMAEKTLNAAGITISVGKTPDYMRTSTDARDEIYLKFDGPNGPMKIVGSSDPSPSRGRRLIMRPMSGPTVEFIVKDHTQDWNRARGESRSAQLEAGKGVREDMKRVNTEIANVRGQIASDVLRNGGPSGSVTPNIEEGRRLAGSEVLQPLLASASALLPKGLTDKLGPVAVTSSFGRGGSYTRSDNTIRMRTDGIGNVRGTMMHELTHFMEDEVPDVARASWAFLKHRTSGDAPKRMYSVYPGRGYKRGDRVLPDKFTNTYSGRLYEWADGDTTLSRKGTGREILTTATEHIFFGKGIAPDAEHRQFALGIIALASQP